MPKRAASCTEPPLAVKGLRVRQAINYPFDSAGLLKALGKGHGTQTAQIFPTSSGGYDPALDSRYAYDLQLNSAGSSGHPPRPDRPGCDVG